MQVPDVGHSSLYQFIKKIRESGVGEKGDLVLLFFLLLRDVVLVNRRVVHILQAPPPFPLLQVQIKGKGEYT